METLMTAEQVCELLHCDRKTIYRRMERAGFPRPLRVARNRVLWRASEVELWINALPRGGSLPKDGKGTAP